LHKEKEMRGVLLVITLISPMDSMMEISESNFVRNIDTSLLPTKSKICDKLGGKGDFYNLSVL
jgi:hypothetical protein